jgi:elongation factor Ts
VRAFVSADGQVGALVSVTTDKPAAEVDAFLKTLGMHIAALRPVALTRDEIPADVVERERNVYMESEDVLKKPEDKREMIVKGKLEKFYKDSALVDQPWVKEPKQSVQKALAEALGADARIERYALFQLG